MKIRFQADNDLNEHIVRAVKRLRPDIDFQTAPALGLHLGVPDEQVLESAAQEGRILVSHDGKTMPNCFAQYIAQHMVTVQGGCRPVPAGDPVNSREWRPAPPTDAIPPRRTL